MAFPPIIQLLQLPTAPRRVQSLRKGKTTSEASIVAYLDELTDKDSNEDSDYQPDESKDSETEESISGTDSEIDFDAFIGELSDQDDIEETASSSKKEDNQTEPDNEEVNVVKLTTILKKDAGKKVYNLPSHRRCAVHQLALVSTTDVNKIKDAGFVLLKKSTFKKLKKLWNKQSRSTKVSDYIVAKLGRLFVVPNITRWNSTLAMLISVFESHSAIRMVITSDNETKKKYQY